MRGKTLSELWTLHKYNWTEFPLPPPEETTLQTVEKVLLSAFRCGFWSVHNFKWIIQLAAFFPSSVFDILFDVLLGFQFSRGTFYTKSDPNYTFEKDDEENLGWIIDCSISQNNDTVWFVYFIELSRKFSNASVYLHYHSNHWVLL